MYYHFLQKRLNRHFLIVPIFARYLRKTYHRHHVIGNYTRIITNLGFVSNDEIGLFASEFVTQSLLLGSIQPPPIRIQPSLVMLCRELFFSLKISIKEEFSNSSRPEFQVPKKESFVYSYSE